MSVSPEIQKLASELLKKSNQYRTAQISNLDLLSGDASSRRYVRIHLRHAPTQSLIMMLLASTPGPLAAVSHGLNQDDTYVALSTFLGAHKLPVPELLVDARPQLALLVEDVGEVALWHLALGLEASGKSETLQALGNDPLTRAYEKAILLIKAMQSIPRDSSCIAFQRQFPIEKYQAEAHEFIEYYARPRGLPAAQVEIVSQFLQTICQRIHAHPPTLSHCDYMSYNLFVAPNGNIRIIDFQDAVLCSPVRDIVALINDRDIDYALGKQRHLQLLNYYLKELNPGPQFKQQYLEYLLHWCFRVSGRFIQLTEKKGVSRYQQWVPGTLKRLGRTLQEATNLIPEVTNVLSILSDFSPEIKAGAQDNWPTPSVADLLLPSD